MLSFLVTCVVLAISASYELIEWALPWQWGRALTNFLVLRAILGIHNPTCCSHLSGQLSHRQYWHERKTAR
jgi:hypothetical protein